MGGPALRDGPSRYSSITGRLVEWRAPSVTLSANALTAGVRVFILYDALGTVEDGHQLRQIGRTRRL